MTPATLTVSIVTYRPDLALLDRTLRTLAASLVAAREQGLMRAANVVLIDNTGTRASASAVITVARKVFRDVEVTMNYLHGHANIGYGAAHNLVMHGGNTNYHLVLNPDVELAVDALPSALKYLGEHAEIGVLAPAARREDGTREYICKRYPTVLDLALRGFAPRALRRLFRKRLDRYEMHDLVDRVALDETISPIPAMSGSFMFVRRKAIEATGGFDPGFFLYFEDFDWSVRLNRVTRSAYVPRVRIVHHGGGATGKGPRHVGYFLRSAARFFNKHGWKWL
ncbi:MAG: glycosyltransferase family 2 protein [Betaproteobacteria bacterium]|nr:MAG: glycosyltransferase family 2 protein [Betaproteobacteria bacterium]